MQETGSICILSIKGSCFYQK